MAGNKNSWQMQIHHNMSPGHDRGKLLIAKFCLIIGTTPLRKAAKPIVPSQKSWRDIVLFTNLCLSFLRTLKQNNTVQLLHPPGFFVSFLGEPRPSPGGLGIRWLWTWLRDGDFHQGPRPRGSVRCWLGDRDRAFSLHGSRVGPLISISFWNYRIRFL